MVDFVEGSLCRKCGKRYRVDLNIPNYLWDDIIALRKTDNKPADPASTMLCGMCIMQYLEKLATENNKYGYLIACTGSIN